MDILALRYIQKGLISWMGKWINTSVSYNQHHQYFKGNYGLYFTIWDRLMGFMRPDYDSAFEELKTRKNLKQINHAA